MNVVDRIARLVKEPSVSAVAPELDQSNRAIAELYGGWLEDAGFSVELQEVAGHHPGRDKRNVIGTLGRGEGGLVLAGHLDTVPYDVSRWRTDPFVLTEEGDALVGLGVADMKAFFAIVLAAIERIDRSKLKRPLIVVGTADEESGMDGAKALAARGHLSTTASARAALIGEPTALRAVRAHKGVAMERLFLVGRSGHSSDPALGRSALEGMRKAMDAIAEVRARLQAEWRDEAFSPPVPTINLGFIRGGDNPNRICADCELTFDVRLLPGMDDGVVHQKVLAAVEKALAGSELSISLAPLHPAIPPFATPATADLVRTVERLTGAPATTAAFGTEAPFFTQLAGETVVLGPGDIEVAHQPGERLPLARIQPMIDLLEKLIGERCG
jgi:acetylornithine deacetylase